jgi:hypothetical protein
MTGGPISDGRLVSCEHDIVTFMARNKDKNSSKAQVPVKLSGVEFTRRWSLHILPKNFTKTRCFGGYSSSTKDEFLALCRALRPQTELQQEPPTEHELEEERDTDDPPSCPLCEQPMQLIGETERPSWRELFYGPDHHHWFES